MRYEAQFNEWYDKFLEEHSDHSPSHLKTQCEEKKYGFLKKNQELNQQSSVKNSIQDKQNRRLAALLQHVNANNN